MQFDLISAIRLNVFNQIKPEIEWNKLQINQNKPPQFISATNNLNLMKPLIPLHSIYLIRLLKAGMELSWHSWFWLIRPGLPAN